MGTKKRTTVNKEKITRHYRCIPFTWAQWEEKPDLSLLYISGIDDICNIQYFEGNEPYPILLTASKFTVRGRELFAGMFSRAGHPSVINPGPLMTHLEIYIKARSVQKTQKMYIIVYSTTQKRQDSAGNMEDFYYRSTSTLYPSQAKAKAVINSWSHRSGHTHWERDCAPQIIPIDVIVQQEEICP